MRGGCAGAAGIGREASGPRGRREACDGRRIEGQVVAADTARPCTDLPRRSGGSHPNSRRDRGSPAQSIGRRGERTGSSRRAALPRHLRADVSAVDHRSNLATFYTPSESAALLAELVVGLIDADWSDPTALTEFRACDFACGTGTLITAAYHARFTRHRRAGGNDAAIHRAMMERSISPPTSCRRQRTSRSPCCQVLNRPRVRSGAGDLSRFTWIGRRAGLRPRALAAPIR